VLTEFQERAGLDADGMPKLLILSAEQVARIGYDSLKRGRRVVVPGIGNWIGTRLVRFVPHAILLPLLDWGTRNRISHR
jgi:short-subunit dehydrogenase